MDGLGPRLWTLWAGLKSPHARARVACLDRAVAVGLGLVRVRVWVVGCGFGSD